MTTIDTTAIRSELALHPDGEPISAIWAEDTVTALCAEVDRLTRALEAAIARDCPRGEDCDMTLAYMAGTDRLRAENERLRATLRRISSNNHQITYCRDGHEEAALLARAALKEEAND